MELNSFFKVFIGFVDRLVLEYKEKIQIKGDSDFGGLLE